MNKEELLKDYTLFKVNIIDKLEIDDKYTPEEKMFLRKIDIDFQWLQHQLEVQEQKTLKVIEYIKSFDIDKSFSFPLMKKWEENQVKSSIDYEFNQSLYKDLLEILGEDNDRNN